MSTDTRKNHYYRRLFIAQGGESARLLLTIRKHRRRIREANKRKHIAPVNFAGINQILKDTLPNLIREHLFASTPFYSYLKSMSGKTRS